MLAYRVAYSGLARYSLQQMANPKRENGETAEKMMQLCRLHISSIVKTLLKLKKYSS
jgi:hypothetical protein